MKAKKILIIELKNPALRRIRKNFRDIIECAVKQEISRLYAISREHRKKGSESRDPVKKERLEQKGRAFMKDGRELRFSLTESIIQCGMSGGCSSYIEATDHGLYPKKAPTNLNMAWLPIHKKWFCTKCCEIIIRGDKIHRKEKHPDHMRYLREEGFLEEWNDDFNTE